jgi:hypothetical protein
MKISLFFAAVLFANPSLAYNETIVGEATGGLFIISLIVDGFYAKSTCKKPNYFNVSEEIRIKTLVKKNLKKPHEAQFLQISTQEKFRKMANNAIDDYANAVKSANQSNKETACNKIGAYLFGELQSAESGFLKSVGKGG